MRSVRSALACGMTAAALLAAGCGSQDDASDVATTAPAGTQTQKTAKAPKVAVLYTVYQDYQQAQEDGMKQVLAKSGGSLVSFNANYDPQKLLQSCKDAVGSGRFNAIVLQVLDPASGIPCVTQAKSAGIPVVALNTAIGKDPNSMEPQVEGVVGGVYTTPAANAQESVDLVRRACEGIDPCKVISEIATPTDPLTNQSVDAIAEGVPNAKVVAKFASGFDPGQVAQKVPDLLNAHPDADVFLSIADSSALAAVPAIKQAGLLGKIKVIGKGGSRAGAKAIRAGLLFSGTGAWPFQEGAIVGNMVLKAVNGQPIDPKGHLASEIDTPRLLDKKDVGQFTAEWGAAR